MLIHEYINNICKIATQLKAFCFFFPLERFSHVLIDTVT